MTKPWTVPVAVLLSVMLKLLSLSFYLYLHWVSNESIVLCALEHIIVTKILVLAALIKIMSWRSAVVAVGKQLRETQNETIAGPSGNGQKSTGSRREREGKPSPAQGSSSWRSLCSNHLHLSILAKDAVYCGSWFSPKLPSWVSVGGSGSHPSVIAVFTPYQMNHTQS